MTNQVGKATENRIEWGRWIVASVDINGEYVAEELDGKAGMNEAEWKLWLTGFRDELDEVTEELYEAARELAIERADDPDHRRERDEIVEELRAEVIRTRDILDSVREDLTTRFGLGGRVPHTPKRLEAYVKTAIEALRKANRTFSSVGFSVHTDDIADDLEPLQEKLEDKLVELAGERREAEALLVERNKVLDSWEQTYRSVARILQGVYRLAGEVGLAERVRPTVGRASGKEAPDEEEPTVEDEPAEPAADADRDEESEPAGV